MSNQYSNLPGVNMTVKDGQLLLTTDRSTNSMLIIAEARTVKQVPDGPVFVTTESQLKENFGGFFYQGEVNPIAAQWAAARQNGIRNIYLMALSNGTKKEKFIQLQDKLFNLMGDLSLSHIVLDGMYADEEIEDLVASDFGVDTFDQVDSVPARINYLGTTPPVAPEEPVTLELVFNQAAITLTLSVDDVDVERLDRDLKEAIAMEIPSVKADISLEGGMIKITASASFQLRGEAGLKALGLTGVEGEMKGYGDVASLLASYAEKISAEVGDTIAYIGVKPPVGVDLAGIKAYVEALLERDNEVSPYLQVVAGPQVGIVVPGNLRTQWVSGVTQYATLVSGLDPQQAPTNQVLLGASALRFNLSLRQLNDLTGAKYVTFRMKNGQIRVVDGVTTAPDLFVGQDIIKSDFTRLSTLRIVNHVVTEIRNACDVFIGSPNEFHNYNAMNTAIKAVIDKTIERGIIQDARYSIALGDTLDSSEINLTVLPQFELRTINVTVGLATPETFNQ